MGPFAQLLDALAEKTHVLTVASRCGDRTLAERTRRDARAIHGELFTSGSPRRRLAEKGLSS
jgi:hypothetical protein